MASGGWWVFDNRHTSLLGRMVSGVCGERDSMVDSGHGSVGYLGLRGVQ